MKIGLYTIHNPYNFGAVLQAFATQKYLESLGHKTEIVLLISDIELKKLHFKYFNYNDFKTSLINIFALLSKGARAKIRKSKSFHARLNFSNRYQSIEKIYDNPPNYDIHLVGSDQVWNLEKGLNQKLLYFLDFIDDSQKKISYASSFGTEKINSSFQKKLKKILSRFRSISVRESDGVKILESCGLQSEQVLDPTFLLDSKDWTELIENKNIVKGEYILYYGFDKVNESQLILNHLKAKLNIPVIAISASLFCPYKVDKFLRGVGPSEFLNLFKNAKFIYTSSFHGVCFAIHFRKSFLTIKHPTRNSRIINLLNQFSLEKRQISHLSELLNLQNDDFYINYEPINDLISLEVAKSKKWLKMNINE
jgi:hypothetical protein